MEIFQENGLYGLKNETGAILIKPQYIEFYPFVCGLACVRNERYQYAYITMDNIPIISFGSYSWIDPHFTCGYARVIKNSPISEGRLWGIINTQGDLVIPCKYDNIWTLNEKYLCDIKASLSGKECHINLQTASTGIILDGLKYLRTYTVEEFKQQFGVKTIHVKPDSSYSSIIFQYGANIGFVADDEDPVLKEPAISIVCNSAGKIFCLLHNKSSFGKSHLSLLKVKDKCQNISETPNPLSSNPQQCSDSGYDEYNAYAENSKLDAFEGDESNYWNID